MTRVRYPILKKCIECSKEFPCYKKRQLENRKYCSHECAYKSEKWREGRAELLQRVGVPYRNRGNIEYGLAEYNKKQAVIRGRKLVKAKNGDILDITNDDLRTYREHQKVCEICGRSERMSSSGRVAQPNKLAVDHDHTTLKFRGLLCSDCNRKLGWYDNLSEKIVDYIGKH